MVKPSISLSFDGQCEAAFRFYERCFGGKITFVAHVGRFAHGQGCAAGMGREDPACVAQCRRHGVRGRGYASPGV